MTTIKQQNYDILKNNNWVTSRKYNKNTKTNALDMLKLIRIEGSWFLENAEVRKAMRDIVGYQYPDDVWTLIKDYLIVPATHPIRIIRGFITKAIPYYFNDTVQFPTLIHHQKLNCRYRPTNPQYQKNEIYKAYNIKNVVI